MDAKKEIHRLDFGATVNELFFDHEGKHLLAVGHGAIKVYRTDDWALQQTLQLDYYVVFTSGHFSPDGKYIFAVGQGGTSRGNCYLWEWQSGKLVKMFNHLGKKIETVTWHPSGEYIVFAGHDPHIFIYRLRDILSNNHDAIRLAQRIWAGDHAEYIHFNKTGSLLCSAHQNGLIKLWGMDGRRFKYQ
ncbi:MAG: WD40 repeat domain-containing protein [Saprospiraceae bacterium]|nr:WD40 repeat domain-containing protein [Saprospiraceae bacterium]